MAFPSNPTDGQQATLGPRTFQYDATKGRWRVFKALPTGSAAVTQADIDAAVANVDVTSQVSAIVNAAPEALDTLDELAAALGDDANFATTVTNSLAAKADTTYVDSAIGAIQGFSGSYDDLTNVPIDLGLAPNLSFSITEPTTPDQYDLWFNPSTAKWNKGIINPVVQSIQNSQISSIYAVQTNGSPRPEILAAGSTNWTVENSSATRYIYVIFANPLWLTSWTGVNDLIGLNQIVMEDGTTVGSSGLYNGDIGSTATYNINYGGPSIYSGGWFNYGKVSQIRLQVKGNSGNQNVTLLASGGIIFDEVDPGYATETYVDNSVAAIVDTAPDALNTLNELAAALNDDANFATTVTNQIATKANTADVYTQAEVDSAIAAIPAGGTNLELTASSDVTTGTPVQIVSDGTIEAVAVETIAANYNIYSLSLSTKRDFSPTMTSWDVDPFNDNKTLAFFEGKFYFIIDTLSAISQSAAIDPPIGSNARIKFDKNQENKLLAITTDGSDSYITIGTVSGTSITWGTPYLYASSAGAAHIVQLNLETSKFVLQSGGTLTIVEPNYSQDTFTVGTAANFPTAGQSLSGSSYLSFDVDPVDPTLIITAWATYEGSTLYGKVNCGTITGNSISFAGTVPFTALSQADPLSANDGIYVAFTGEESGKFVINMTEAGSSSARTHFVVAQLTDLVNSTYTKGTQSTLIGGGQYSSSVNVPYNNIFVNPSDPTKVIITREVAFNSSSYGAQFKVITISGLAYSVASFDAARYSSDRTMHSPIIVWKKDGSGEFYRTNITQSNAGAYYNYNLFSVKSKIEVLESNIRPYDIIGLANETVSSGGTVKVNTTGTIDANQTGLTPGSDIYVNTDGTLSATATNSNYKIGVASSATEILVQTIEPAIPSYNDLKDKPSIPSITGLATETYVDNSVAAIVDTAPETLNTLNELAAALGDDANFAATVTNSLASKASVSYVDSEIASISAGGTAIYDSDSLLPIVGNAGDTAFVKSTNTFYVYSGDGWFSLTAAPPAQGQEVFESTVGTSTSYNFTVPSGVTSVCAVAVGEGGRMYSDRAGGGGGALAYVNNVSVTPGEVLTIAFGSGFSDLKYSDNTIICRAEYGAAASTDAPGGSAANCIGDVAYSGANGTPAESPDTLTRYEHGGGGAAGYLGDGNTEFAPKTGYRGGQNPNFLKGGGGIGLQGTTVGTVGAYKGAGAYGGGDGISYNGGNYGGGAGGLEEDPSAIIGTRGKGAIRIMWGNGRSYPSQAQDVTQFP